MSKRTIFLVMAALEVEIGPKLFPESVEKPIYDGLVHP
jgi:hypothetical protein